MGDVLNVLLGVVLLFVGVWVVIFGGIGGLLARTRGGSVVTGFAWGTLLGPMGWGIVWLRTRGGERLDRDDGLDGWEAASTTATESTEKESSGIRF